MEKEESWKEIVLSLTLLEDLDSAAVTTAERLHYRGLVDLPVEEILQDQTAEIEASKARDQMETEMMGEYMREKFGSEAGRRDENCKLLME